MIDDTEFSNFELERVLPLGKRPDGPSIEELTSLSVDTIKRRYPDWIVKLSEKRLGMKFKHGLVITRKMKTPA